MTEEAEALLEAQHSLHQLLQQRDAAASELMEVIPHLLGSGHISSDAQRIILNSLCKPGQHDQLSKLAPGPLAMGVLGAAGGGAMMDGGEKHRLGGDADVDMGRMSLHSHPLLVASMAGGLLKGIDAGAEYHASVDCTSFPAVTQQLRCAKRMCSLHVPFVSRNLENVTHF
jgi:hypothetical protein